MKSFKEYITESKISPKQEDELTQLLANSDIENIVDGDTVFVDKKKVKETKDLIKQLGFNIKVKGK